ncbi:MAG TPA: AAA family ATPase [Pirellulales bacterium]|nr:AAA family ATPase [Pirellulales bacterium]
MLKSLSLKNFTAFTEARLSFASNLNVIVGENSTGKTHILKVAYSALYAGATRKKEQGPGTPTKAYLQTAIADKLNAVFRPDELGRLARRASPGRQRCEVSCLFSPNKPPLAFSFNTTSKSEVTIDKTPSAWPDKLPVYLPTRELLTIYPGFVSLYETTHLSFEETWRDTCILLGAPLARGPREKRIRELLVPLEEAMGGKVELDKAGRFYLNVAGVSTEMHLVAEGLRKLAMLARLIATGSLVDKGFLFWDEPESNLNPKAIKMIARTILSLCQSGIQVFLASHSLFLLRELDILLQRDEFKAVKTRFIGLHRGEEGVEATQGDTIDDIGSIDALTEELSQSDRYLKVETE